MWRLYQGLVEAILNFVEAILGFMEAILNLVKTKSTPRFDLDLDFDKRLNRVKARSVIIWGRNKKESIKSKTGQSLFSIIMAQI